MNLFFFFILGYDTVSDKSNLLVNCGATEHIITNKSRFINFHQNFEPGNHFVELADGSPVEKRWCLHLSTQQQKTPVYLEKCIIYTNFLNKTYFQYKWQQKNGAHISFECDNCQLIYPNKAVFNITQRGCLYYLKNIVSARNATYDLHTWHKILGHCNESDIKKLLKLVKGMKIKLTPNYALNYDIYIQGKMSNDRNKTLDCKATKILALVHSDLAGPIQSLAKDGYDYVINFINDYSCLTMLYFLKCKSDTLFASK